MHITILGGGGFLGRKLAARLAREGQLDGRRVTALTLFDLNTPVPPAEAPFPIRTLAGDVTDRAALAEAIPPQTEVIFHLAAVVSAAAEADFDLGMKVNLHGTLAVLDTCRTLPKPPRVVFTSSVASFGGGQGAMVPDDGRQVPANSYGAQKAIGELLLQDASRRGFLDAVCIRLPTVMVRPGRPNKAASSFVSAVLREPLLGLPATCPVEEDFAVWICSPRRAVEWFLYAATMDTAPLGLDRGINPPGASVSVAQMLAALPQEARRLVSFVPDTTIQAIVSGWPAAFTAERARRLGFSEQEPLTEVVRAFIEDDLEATRAERATG
ncbi:NAD-dependent epimerase/dehydratase family protein [Roseomonas sp. M0104]|uniref:NAD-dependent epimerase/dehydratase family protein n=1 Tax=Teichococcus coralli TaxID=2545983 RepID=A0A845BA18_9PROT|nr:D-erythronate dehydrogenase [Pseudoroseomonas coralli]MXP62207.1 NAD-dependent epimerase/dehydratase family protein [Pseudoroseomonas coralli]